MALTCSALACCRSRPIAGTAQRVRPRRARRSPSEASHGANRLRRLSQACGWQPRLTFDLDVLQADTVKRTSANSAERISYRQTELPPTKTHLQGRIRAGPDEAGSESRFRWDPVLTGLAYWLGPELADERFDRHQVSVRPVGVEGGRHSGKSVGEQLQFF